MITRDVIGHPQQFRAKFRKKRPKYAATVHTRTSRASTRQPFLSFLFENWFFGRDKKVVRGALDHSAIYCD